MYNMATEAIVKKWGNSVGIIFPRDLVKKKRIKVNDKVLVEVVKEVDLRKVFGSLKTKMTSQKFKDLARKGWD